MIQIKNQYFIVACASFFVFCAALRWEPYVSRYMLSYLAVLCPAIVGQLELFFDSSNRKFCNMEMKFTAIFYFLCVTELMGLFYYHGSIALEKKGIDGYFMNRDAVVKDNYSRMVKLISDKECKNIGLLISGNEYEYPLTIMINNYDRIEHVNVTNATGKYENLEFVPDVIIAVDYELVQDMVLCHDIKYEVTEKIDDGFCLLERVVK